MNNIPIILFNGPAGVGKDTLARYVQFRVPLTAHIKIITPIKHAVASIFNYPVELMESGKDSPEHVKYNKTIRQHIIDLGEYLRGQHGPEMFSLMLADRIRVMGVGVKCIVVSDLGIEDEIKGLVKVIDKKRCTIIRLNQTGKTFEGDCRHYVSGVLSGVESYDVTNEYGNRKYAETMIDGLLKSKGLIS